MNRSWHIALVALMLFAVAGTTRAAGADWTRFGFDAARSSASPVHSAINAANVSSLKRQQVRIDGVVDASAIYLHGVEVKGARHDVFFVTTSYGKTLAIDAANGAILWRYTPPGYDRWAGTYRITNATPVADPDRRFIYAASPDGYIQKLAVADGHAVWRAAITRLAAREKIASPLNFFDGRVIATTGGYIGDRPPYQGHVAVLDGASGDLLQVWNSLCSDRHALIDPASCPESGSAIWGRAGAVVDPATGGIFVATGNGRWDGRTYWGDAALQLNATADRLLGNYTPTDTHMLNITDADLGSTSPVLLGNGLVVQGGKDGKLRLLSVEHMHGTTPHRGNEIQTVPTPGGAQLFTAPAVWHTNGRTWLFVADSRGTEAWTLRDGRLHPEWHNRHAGTSPVLAGGLLFIYDPGGGLRVYQPTTGAPLTVLACGPGHWNSPIVADGRIALPEGNANRHGSSGVLSIWRLR